jgi:trimeric autotransporter adhesin
MKRIVATIVAAIFTVCAFAQAPQKMSYQAVIRNTSNVLVANHAVGIRISILQGSPTGTEVYKETYSPVPQTNANGLVTLEIGGGIPVTGIFSNINWSAGPYFLKTEVDPNGLTDYTITGTSQLLSVPYAYYTNSAGNGFASSYSAGEKRPVLNLSDGNIGLEVAPDSWNKLNINGPVNIIPNAIRNQWGSVLSLDARSQSGGLIFSLYSFSNFAGEGGGKFLIRSQSGNSSFLMDNNGHNGINKYNPSYNFDVNGDINFTGSLLRNGNSLITPQGSIKVKPSESNMDSALFEVRNTTGQVIFAVYNEGVRIYVDDGVAKGTTKGGFAIGSFDKSKGTSQTLFIVDPDSIRGYIDTGLVKTTKGGFAIGSFDRSKAGRQQFFRVTQDSIRMYINDSPTKAVKGGFAIGGFDKSKGPNNQYLRVTHDSTRIITLDTLKGFGVSSLSSGNTLGYLRLTPSNYFIGHQSGYLTTTGSYNSVLGYKAGFGITTGTGNVLLGYQAGYINSSGGSNVFLGYRAGFASTQSFNTFLGYQAGTANTIGQYNAFMGYNTGLSNTAGSSNVFIGNQAGYRNSSGNYNVFLGNTAGYNNTTSNNVFIGYESGYMNTSGTTNAFMGYRAGRSNTIGSSGVYIGNLSGYSNSSGGSNVAIGDRAGYSNTSGSYNVFLGYMSGYLNNGSMNTFVGYISGRNNTSGVYNSFFGDSTGYMNSTGYDNTFIGGKAGYSNTTSWFNTFVGAMTGYYNTGYYNTALGAKAFYSNTSGTANVALGNRTLSSNTTGGSNTATGESALYLNTTGNSNVANGQDALYSNINGYSNTAVGVNSLYTNSSGYGNSAFGMAAMINNKRGYYNTAVGTQALSLDSTGNYNTILGYYALVGNRNGSNNTSIGALTGNANKGSGNVFIGYQAGFWETGSRKFYLADTLLNPPLIYGDFSTGTVALGTITPSTAYKLYINGSAYATGTWASSDIRWKKNIAPLDLDVARIMQLQPVRFDWRKDEFPSINFEDGNQIGLIAQEVEKLFPELVKTDENGYKAVSYEKLSVILLEGMKEQQKEIDELKSLVSTLVANQNGQGNK